MNPFRLLIILIIFGSINIGCTMRQTSDQLDRISQQLSETSKRLDEFDGSPDARKVVDGLISTTDGIRKITNAAIDRVASEVETRDKVAAGLGIGGEIVGGPFGMLLSAAAAALAGGGAIGAHNRSVRRQKEKSNNHGVKEGMSAILDTVRTLTNKTDKT